MKQPVVRGLTLHAITQMDYVRPYLVFVVRTIPTIVRSPMDVIPIPVRQRHVGQEVLSGRAQVSAGRGQVAGRGIAGSLLMP